MLARFLSGLGKTMVSVGAIVFLFVSFKLWGTELEESMGDIDPADSKKLPKPAEGESLGVMHLKPSQNQAGIDMRKVFIEGTDKDDLKAGPGHYPGTPFPGQKGNASIAGHRVTYGAPFRRIDELVPADEQGPAH
jgi:sortase A